MATDLFADFFEEDVNDTFLGSEEDYFPSIKLEPFPDLRRHSFPIHEHEHSFPSLSNGSCISFEDSFCHESFCSFAHDVNDDDSTIATATEIVEEEAHFSRVTFATTTIVLHIPVALGDHPACSNGPPVELEDTYENACMSFEPIHFFGRNPPVSVDREDILLQAGYSVKQLQKAKDAAASMQASRCRSLMAAFLGEDGHIPLSKQERMWINRIVMQTEISGVTEIFSGYINKTASRSMTNKNVAKPLFSSSYMKVEKKSLNAPSSAGNSLQLLARRQSLMARSA